MRICRFLDAADQTHFGVDLGDGNTDLLGASPLDAPPTPTGRVVPIHRRLAPLEPANIFCIGLNYREHARETGAQLPEHPVVFMKPTTALNHPDMPIFLPRCQYRGKETDYEVELAVVIGRTGRDIAEKDALGYVLGYTVANDVSARRWQKHAGGGQWIRGKGFDSFCPLGPVLVTADEIADPQNLSLKTTLNGNVMQEGHTSDMIFTVAQLIAFLSQDTTLRAGTVILTGTPPGVGVARKPPMFLDVGDEVIVEIEGIGQLRNRVENAP